MASPLATQPTSPTTNDLDDTDFPSTSTGYTVGKGGIVLKSTDGGESFQVLKDVMNAVGGLAITTTRSGGQTVFAGDSRGVHRSTNGGQTWEF